MKTFIYCLFFLLLLSGCKFGSHTSNNIYPPAPLWLQQPAANDTQWLIGVAQATSMELAINTALTDLRLRLKHSLNDSYQLQPQHIIYTNKEQAIKAANAYIDKIQPAQLQLQYSSQLDDNRYAAQVQVQRQNLLQQLNNQLELQLSSLERQLRQKQQTNSLELFQHALQLGHSAKQLITDLIVIQSIDPDFKQQPYLARIQAFDQQAKLLKNSLQFSLYNQRSSRQVLQAVKQQLESEGYVLTNANNTAESFRIYLSDHSKLSHSAGQHILRLTLDFKVTDQRNQLIGSNSIELTGSASDSQQSAEQDALRQFNQLLKQRGVLSILGVKVAQY